MDQLTNQAIDMIFENDALRDRVIRPIKKKAFPYILTGVAFNLILLILLFYIIYKVHRLDKLYAIINE
jgi:hypothetical protein